MNGDTTIDREKEMYQMAGLDLYQRAIRYEKGIDMQKNTHLAFEWMRKAAMRGFLKAQMDLSMYYTYGIGTQASLEKAFIWTKMAAKKGYRPAVKRLAECYGKGLGTRKDIQKAYRWMQILEQGDMSVKVR